jgi:serine/threonine protein kinase
MTVLIRHAIWDLAVLHMPDEHHLLHTSKSCQAYGYRTDKSTHSKKTYGDNKTTYKIYVTDFRIARSYQDITDVETDFRTPFSRTYAAPEVVRQDKRGFPADIFSLGCVFLEMLTVLADKKRAILDLRKQNARDDMSYQANIRALWYSDLLIGPHTTLFRDAPPYFDDDVIRAMLDPDADMRPTALILETRFCVASRCCFRGPEPFEAVDFVTTDTLMLEHLFE